MTQLDINDFCKCSFGVDNVVFLTTRIITGNFDIVNMYKCSKSEIFFVCLRQIGLFMSSWVTVIEYVNPCIATTPTVGRKQPKQASADNK